MSLGMGMHMSMSMRIIISMSVQWVHSFPEAQQLLKLDLVPAEAQAQLILHSLQSSSEKKKKEEQKEQEKQEAVKLQQKLAENRTQWLETTEKPL